MLKALSPRVYYMEHVQETDRPALGLIVGENYSIAVDAGNSPAHASLFLEQATALTQSPIEFVVITHWHWDHVFGIRTMNCHSISHFETKEKIAIMTTQDWDDASLDERVVTGEEISFCSEMIKKEMPVRDDLILKVPDITFTQTMTLDLGGITAVIDHVGGVHAPDSSIVYVPQEHIVFVGDCLYQDFYSGEWSYDLQAFQVLVDKLLRYEARWYVLGHQHPKTKEDFTAFVQEILTIGELVGQAESLHDVQAVYEQAYGHEPSEDEREWMRNFIAGNHKKRNAQA
ncbi:Zn-dependent hydrolase [Fictibacillus macauensis ZFHKF-1]|uniref:Zn-dependent hydrolase n=1 Tax=Fictibacillus macauensis ZFHKF-1 TaxID=1196324 RepID=I8IXW9_9BACL|nr:MBL fold metallo-hydrolase [Fictibacillus macauensis]EIT84341.1 Zn-dependent hydrolase [Fictibacillus macauensis ZFHKF-1]